MLVHRGNECEGQFGDIKPNLLWVVCIYIFAFMSEKNPVLLFSTLEPEWLKENIKSKITIWLTAVVSVQYVSLCPELQLETLHMCKYFKCSQKMALSACVNTTQLCVGLHRNTSS